ncbi:DUF4241 domain-containing protein [Dactylosporangium cerinum]|uniref:DUF4241 domain-containing protein n=1 Tax=Dactylosporangium cerinum TaxID=1434730 RepID=A0ABV9WG72_9ACTN
MEFVDVVRHQLAVSRGGRPPWRPPRPFAPHGIGELFRPDAVVEVEDRRLGLSVHTAGPLHLTSGRLVAADPSSLDFDAVPFTVLVPPGSYPVSVSLATFVDDPRHSRVCAVRLDVTHQPVIRWEMALRDGQEPLELGYGEFFGFGVDAGMACFVDADAAGRMQDVWRTLAGLVEPRYRTIDSGAMVAWSSGWGDGAYPTWIGYDATGSVACFVADMLLFPTGDDAQDDEEDED